MVRTADGLMRDVCELPAEARERFIVRRANVVVLGCNKDRSEII